MKTPLIFSFILALCAISSPTARGDWGDSGHVIQFGFVPYKAVVASKTVTVSQGGTELPDYVIKGGLSGTPSWKIGQKIAYRMGVDRTYTNVYTVASFKFTAPLNSGSLTRTSALGGGYPDTVSFAPYSPNSTLTFYSLKKIKGGSLTIKTIYTLKTVW